MQLFAIYNKKAHGRAWERGWYKDDADSYYRGTGWPDSISSSSVLKIGSVDLCKAFEVEGSCEDDAQTAYVVCDEEYRKAKEELQQWVRHTVPKIKVKAVFTNEAEAKAAYPGAEVKAYEINHPAKEKVARLFSPVTRLLQSVLG